MCSFFSPQTRPPPPRKTGALPPLFPDIPRPPLQSLSFLTPGAGPGSHAVRARCAAWSERARPRDVVVQRRLLDEPLHFLCPAASSCASWPYYLTRRRPASASTPRRGHSARCPPWDCAAHARPAHRVAAAAVAAAHAHASDTCTSAPPDEPLPAEMSRGASAGSSAGAAKKEPSRGGQGLGCVRCPSKTLTMSVTSLSKPAKKTRLPSTTLAQSQMEVAPVYLPPAVYVWSERGKGRGGVSGAAATTALRCILPWRTPPPHS